MSIYKLAPYFIYKRLFGDRKKWGLVPNLRDSCWLEWEEKMPVIYEQTQKAGIGKTVNDAGYKVLNQINLDNKTVLEIGPGSLEHMSYWQGNPDKYYLIDRREEFLKIAKQKLSSRNITINTCLTDGTPQILPIQEQSVDVIISFYNLEHLFNLPQHIYYLDKLLSKNGIIIGAIPAEGGFAWGLGRYLTTRRWFLKNTNINPDKIICWEHPNFADYILSVLDKKYQKQLLRYWPLKIPVIDLNLVITFIFKK